MMEIPVQKGVPIPSDRIRYPFQKMEVGDSFVVPHEKALSMRQAAGHYGRRGGV